MSRLRHLSDTVRAGQELSPLEKEMASEMAATLGRAGERVEAALSRIAELEREADGFRDPARVQAYNRAIDQAELRIWELVVQREALGFRRHETIPRVYPVPRRRRVRSSAT
jgi:hypothetical protein